MMKLTGLNTQRLGRSFFWFDRLDSTNTYLLERGNTLPGGTAVAAGQQTAGRGRLGRPWQGGGEDSLAFSVLMRDLPAQVLPLLPLLCGLSAAQALEELTGSAPQLKWPNDLLLAKKKVAGILCECRGEGGETWAVCGIGLNLRQPQAYFEENQLPHAGSVALCCGRAPGREEFACAYLNRLEENLDRCAREGFAALLPAYERRCVNLGRMVELHRPSGVETALCVGVGRDGALLCRRDGEVFSVQAGEVSVRGLWGYV